MSPNAPAPEQEAVSYDIFKTSLGWVGIAASARGLRRTTLPEPTAEGAMSALAPDVGQSGHDPEAVAAFRAKITAYLEGEPVDLTRLPIDPARGTEFFLRAWDACRSIPAGETRTYAWLAEAGGRPRAMRAAGQAMARNPLPLVVPCHRVVGSDGGLHGFGGSVGLPMKSRLLELEKGSVSAAA